MYENEAGTNIATDDRVSRYDQRTNYEEEEAQWPSLVSGFTWRHLQKKANRLFSLAVPETSTAFIGHRRSTDSRNTATPNSARWRRVHLLSRASVRQWSVLADAAECRSVSPNKARLTHTHSHKFSVRSARCANVVRASGPRVRLRHCRVTSMLIDAASASKSLILDIESNARRNFTACSLDPLDAQSQRPTKATSTARPSE